MAIVFPLTVILAAFTITQYPLDWLQSRDKLIAIIFFHALGLLCVGLMVFRFDVMDAGRLKDLITFVSSVYFSVTLNLCIILVIRRIILIAAHRIKWDGKFVVRQIDDKHRAISVLLALCVFIGVYGYINIDTLDETHYTVDLTQNQTQSVSANRTPTTMRVALMTDVHLGAGSNPDHLRHAIEGIEATSPDIVLIAGDMTDSTTSPDELEQMTKLLPQTDAPLGTYFVDGDHDYDGPYDTATALTDAGVVILHDQTVEIDGLYLTGRNGPKSPQESPAQLSSDADLTPADASIMLTHRPAELQDISDAGFDLIVAGHTHGYRYPFSFIGDRYSSEVVYGQEMVGNADVIVSSGVSAWGFQFKWPSTSEYNIIDVTYYPAAD